MAKSRERSYGSSAAADPLLVPGPVAVRFHTGVVGFFSSL